VGGLGLRRGRWVREGSESELIEGVGHFLMLEKPAEINGRILRFLGKA
jgi:pimeloyl-ACP methyl ester carboxylesterase